MKKTSLLLIGIILCLACIQGAGAFSSKYHYDLTGDALNDEGVGYDHPQVNFIIVNNFLTDFIGSTKSTEDVSCWAIAFGENSGEVIDNTYIPDVFSDSDEIETLFDDYAHFTRRENSRDLSFEWDRLQEKTYQEVKRAKAAGDNRALLVTLGLSLHTVQDFYAHSNWAEMTEEGYFSDRGYSGDVTWFDLDKDLRNDIPGLNSVNHDQKHKDWASRPHFDTAYRQGYYASRQWITLVRSWAGEEFWNKAMAKNIDTSDWGCFDDLGGSRVALEDFFMRIFWWSGTWNTGGSEGIELSNIASYYGFSINENHGAGSRLNYDDDYRRLFSVPESIGERLYKQEMKGSSFYLSSEAHPEMYEKVPVVRWLRIKTLAITQTDCDVVQDIDTTTGAEYYTVIRVDGHDYYEAPYKGDDDPLPNDWVANIPVPLDWKNVDVSYEIWENDRPAFADDHADIAPEEGQKNWIRTLRTDSPKTTVETDGLTGCSWGTSDGDGNEAKVRFTYEFVLKKKSPRVNLTSPVQPIIRGTTGSYTVRLENVYLPRDTFSLEVPNLTPGRDYRFGKTLVPIEINYPQTIPLDIYTPKCPTLTVFAVCANSTADPTLETCVDTPVRTAPPPARQVASDTYEPNDLFAYATPVTLASESTSARLEGFTLDSSGSLDQDYFRIEYPSPESLDCGLAKQGGYGPLEVKDVEGGIFLSVEEEYCRPLDIRVYSSEKTEFKDIPARGVNQIKIPCSALHLSPNQNIFLSIGDSTNMGMRYNLSLVYGQGVGRILRQEEDPGILNYRPGGDEAMTGRTDLVGNFFRSLISLPETILSAVTGQSSPKVQTFQVAQPSPRSVTPTPIVGRELETRPSTTIVKPVISKPTTTARLASCPAGSSSCNGNCFDLMADSSNCGSCGNACRSPASCRNGICVALVASTTSPPPDCGKMGLSSCRGNCVDLMTDTGNCGYCGSSCPTNAPLCAKGVCISVPRLCPAGTTNCNGNCVDLMTDAANCGYCGHACATGKTCEAGKCCMPFINPLTHTIQKVCEQ